MSRAAAAWWRNWRPRLARLEGWAFLLPLALYWRTLAPTVYNLDSAELTVAAATGGITRATGYPLYLIIGGLWSRLPLGDVGYRLNLLSAVCGAVALLLADRLLRRDGVSRTARYGALGLLAVAPFYWSLSLVAEVYTLHVALMAGLLLLLRGWAEKPTPARLGLAVLWMGLSMGNHVTMVLLAPGCLWYVLTTAPREALRPRALLLAGGGLLLGVCVYGYVPWRFGRMPAFNYAGSYDSQAIFHPINLRTLDGLWWLVSGKQFSSLLFTYTAAELLTEVSRFINQLWQAFLIIGIGPGLLGLVVTLRRDWRWGGALLLMFLANVIFYVNYRVLDKATMFLPAYFIWALWLAVGYQWLLRWAAAGEQGRANGWLLRGIIAAAVLVGLFVTWPRVDLSTDWSARERGEQILAQVEENALIVGWWDTIPLVEYLQLVENQRPDVQAINRFLIDRASLNQLIYAQSGQRPVYINEPIIALRAAFEFVPVGPLYAVRPRQEAP